MAQVTLNRTQTVDTTNDNVVIAEAIEFIRGGRTLDVTGWDKETIPAGHPIIYDAGEYKPIALSVDEVTGEVTIDETNAAKVVGILGGTLLTTDPRASIVVRGTVNPEAAVYSIPASVQDALPLIRFEAD
ncbi:hypothetical protein [Anaerophaga thermohalophila]|jgi:hypothetical protein|uniref:hypothetical protein n=1 Tax=Anaerophaga thermohalophila TaxID=177400 RepID=UPI000237C812|nr:hypothetical protein [Anaerophaga thermohalophila]